MSTPETSYSTKYRIFNTIIYHLYFVIETIKSKLNTFMNYMVQFHNSIKQNEIIYFDFETTGLNPYHNKIIDYSFLLEESDFQETYIESLINPKTKFEKKITDITGIHPDDLENQPTIEQKVPQIYQFINENYRKILHKYIPETFLVAHNCDGFDKVFLMRLFEDRKRYPLASNWKFIDTLPLAKKLLPKLYSHSLKSLSQHYNIKAGTHRAFSDTVCLRLVFHELVKTLCAKEGHIMSYYMDHPQRIVDYYSFN